MNLGFKIVFSLDYEAVQMFIKKGGDIHNERDILLRTALLNGNDDAVNLLLQHGAYVHKEDYVAMQFTKFDIYCFGEHHKHAKLNLGYKNL